MQLLDNDWLRRLMISRLQQVQRRFVVCCSYYLLVSLSVLPAPIYPALLVHGTSLLSNTAASWPSTKLPLLEWLAGQLDPVQLAGAAMFMAGNLLQWHSHWLLARLSDAGSKGGYKIPRGEGCRHALKLLATHEGLGGAGCWTHWRWAAGQPAY
jgi:hypothetical protein